MTLTQAIIWYIVKFIFIAAVAVCGIFLGVSLRKRSDRKKSAEADTDYKTKE
ncbi:MAG: hypothetical protein ACI4DS_03560 [Eubacterium sp.]